MSKTLKYAFKEAELLIKDDLSVKYIRGYVVYNNRAKDILKAYGIVDNMIVVEPKYYF